MKRPLLIFSLGIIACGAFFVGIFSVLAETNIVDTPPTDRYAWDDIGGWWDFYSTNTVQVWGTRLQGYASSTIGEMSLDCATSPAGNICGFSNYGICNGPGPHNPDGTCPNGDGEGILSGYAWNDTIGWISFCGGRGTEDCPGAIPYGVTIDSNGDFGGYAWNDIVGWISFNCANDSSCSTSDFRLTTTWRATSSIGYLESSIFDTQTTAGTVLNSIIWQGTLPSQTCVDFQIAASNSSSGPWNYIGPSGDDSTYYGASCLVAPNGGIGCANPNIPVCVKKSDFSGYRYLRYKVRISSDPLQTKTPIIEDIILNWSP